MVRGSWRSWRRTRAAVARVREGFMGGGAAVRRWACGIGGRARSRPAASASSTRWRKAASTVSVRVRVRRASGVSSARISPSRMRSRRWQRSASSMTWEETRSVAPRSAAMAVEEVPQVAAQDGVEADGGFVEDEEFGGAEEGDGEGDAAALAAGEVAGEGVGVGGEVDVGDGAGDVLVAAVGGGAAGVEDRGEVVEVLADRQVVVDGGGLGDVADAGAEGGVAGGVAEDVEGAGDLGLGADDRAHEGGLAAAGGAEQAGDLAARDGEVEAAQDGAGASDDGEGFGVDGRCRRSRPVGWRCGGAHGRSIIHHAMNNATGSAAASSVRTGDLRPPASASDPLRVKAATHTTVFTHRACADLQIRTPDWTQ